MADRPPDDPWLEDEARRFVLRRWLPADAAELARAWLDPEIVARCRVPDDRSPRAAAGWIDRWQERWSDGSSIDLAVTEPGGTEVWGEVGAARIRSRARRPAGPTSTALESVGARTSDRETGDLSEQVPGSSAADVQFAYDVGWWLAAEHRGQGIACDAVRMFCQWLELRAAGAPIVARIPAGHTASERVAQSAGFVLGGRLQGGGRLWAWAPEQAK